MRKIIAAINMTVDGFCDHTSAIANDELHEYYTELLHNAGAILYGRITYQLMEYWQTVLKNPTGNKGMNDFALAIDKVPKIVFSRTMQNVEWESARVAKRDLKDEVLDIKQQSGKDVFVSSPSLIVSLTELQLIDEYQLCIHPIIAGSGLPLFKNIKDRVLLKLVNTKIFDYGAVTLFYEPLDNR